MHKKLRNPRSRSETLKRAKIVLFITFLIAFGVAFHDWAGAQLRAGGINELLAPQGGWFGFAFMLAAFLIYTIVFDKIFRD